MLSKEGDTVFWMLHDVTGNIGQGYARCRYFILTTSDTSGIDASVGCPVPPFFASPVFTPQVMIPSILTRPCGMCIESCWVPHWPPPSSLAPRPSFCLAQRQRLGPVFFRDSLLEEFGEPLRFEMIRYDSTTLDEILLSSNLSSTFWVPAEGESVKNNERSLHGYGYNVVGWVGVIDDMRHHKQYVMSFTSEYVLDILEPFSSCKVKLPYNFSLLNLLNNFKRCLDIAFFSPKTWMKSKCVTLI